MLHLPPIAWILIGALAFAAYVVLMIRLIDRAPYQCPECGHLHQECGYCDACGWDVRSIPERPEAPIDETLLALEHPLLAVEAVVAGWREMTAFLDDYRAPGQSNIAVVRNLAFVHDLVAYLQDNGGLEPDTAGDPVTGNVSSEPPAITWRDECGQDGFTFTIEDWHAILRHLQTSRR